MRIASIPINEELRLQDLYMYDILDSDAESEFDELLEVAAQIYGCPIAAITFIDNNRQWLKSKIGIDTKEGSREESFCSHTILEDKVLLVQDAKEDERFWDNPAVTSSIRIRFYAGAPIISKAGYRLGAVCVIDNQPRELRKEQTKMLRIISRQISKLLELRLKNKLLKQRAEEQQELEKRLLLKTLQEQERERLSISTELHENIAQGLAATKFYLELAEGADVAKDELIRKSKNNITTLVQQVRDLSKTITPTTFKDANLEDLLKELLSQFYNCTNIEAKLLYKGAEELPYDIILVIYRTIEEQLDNIKQYANATTVEIRIDVRQSVHVAIRDNGVGLNVTDFKRGTGLNKIVLRVENLKGKVDILAGTNAGCQLRITIPLPKHNVQKELALQ